MKNNLPNNSYGLGSSNNYINKAIIDNGTGKFDPYNSTFDELIKEDRNLLNEGKITEKDYGAMMIHAFVSRVHIVNRKYFIHTII